ncbi:hypothetical protein DAEQUDRAFT_800600 [Daedalea quercina L-15889]|uniref:DUF6533 domain-containing protein n=1 Tax=Daedalea quercina L-15889 TaxID=1314783 RepID=A0A165MIG3_9APHY|nr:hypothetical protein DAEQUDRAFT_800600 [Daedalea quercina L-15889]
MGVVPVPLSPSEQVLTAQQNILTFNFCVAFATITFYDHVITVPRETQLMLSKRMAGASVFLLVNRLMLLAYGLALFVQMFHWDTSRGCAFALLFFYVTNVISFAVVAVFSALRAYAISRFNVKIASVVLLLGLAPVAINIYTTIEASYAYVTMLGSVPACCQTPHFNVDTAHLLHYVAGIAAILADVVVIGTTWYSTYLVRKQARQANISTPLTTLILRDGTLYFSYVGYTKRVL